MEKAIELENQNQTFTETLAVVKYKIENKLPMTTAKEELMEDFIEEWTEIFGYEEQEK